MKSNDPPEVSKPEGVPTNPIVVCPKVAARCVKAASLVLGKSKLREEVQEKEKDESPKASSEAQEKKDSTKTETRENVFLKIDRKVQEEGAENVDWEDVNKDFTEGLVNLDWSTIEWDSVDWNQVVDALFKESKE